MRTRAHNRMTAAALLSTAGIVAMGLAGATVDQSAAAGSGLGLVPKTIGTPAVIDIPAAGAANGMGMARPYPSAIKVTAFPKAALVRDVNVTLRGFSHTLARDVDVLLVHGAVSRTVLSDVGNFGINDIGLTLDDEAGANVSSPVAAGVFRPTNLVDIPGNVDVFPEVPQTSQSANLAGFDGQKANGMWKLFVVDDAAGDTGQIGGGWVLQIRAAVPR